MSVITFASLKGGVGKTSLSVNVADAFSHRGCTTLIIDLDPAAHASRLFRSKDNATLFPKHAPLAQAFLAKEAEAHRYIQGLHKDRRPYETPLESQATGEDENPLNLQKGALEEINFVIPVRKSLELLPATSELRYFVPAQGAKFFAKRFPKLIEELKSHFDHIVIDTPPDFNILTRIAMSCSDLVVSPVDTSEMGIHSAEELLRSSSHIKRPVWALVRTMVNSRAQRTQILSNSRLEANLILQNTNGEGPHEEQVPNVSNNKEFVGLLNGWQLADEPHSDEGFASKRTIYLLDAVTFRSEAQNQLSFLGRTAFDLRKTASLARQYLGVAHELEEILASLEDNSHSSYSAPLSERLQRVVDDRLSRREEESSQQKSMVL